MICRVLDDDRSGYLGFKEFLQAIDLMGARWQINVMVMMINLTPHQIKSNHFDQIKSNQCDGYDRPDRTPDDKLRWAFKMYDEDNSREVDIQEMENVMVVSCFR